MAGIGGIQQCCTWDQCIWVKRGLGAPGGLVLPSWELAMQIMRMGTMLTGPLGGSRVWRVPKP